MGPHATSATSVEIEYCVPSGVRERALDLAEAILAGRGADLDELELRMGDGGVFRVRGGGETVYVEGDRPNDRAGIATAVGDALRVEGAIGQGRKAPGMTAVVAAENLRRRYGDTVALDGVSLTLSEGEVFVLVGPNGAGKTTLVRALTGTTEVDGGVELFGRPPQAVARERLGVLPQTFRPYERLTAGELVGYYAGLYDDPRPVASVLDDVGLAGVADTWYERLSGGQRRRACLATTLVNDPDLLVLDEPTTGIDPAGRRAIRELVGDLVAGGTTVLLTTHAMDEATRVGDRVGLLADGRLVARDAPAALVADHGGEPVLSIEGVTDASLAGRVEHDATIEDGTLSVAGVDPREIGAIVDDLEAAGADPTAIRWREPDLEDAFLALAGRDGERAGTGGQGDDGAGAGGGHGSRPHGRGGGSE